MSYLNLTIETLINFNREQFTLKYKMSNIAYSMKCGSSFHMHLGLLLYKKYMMEWFSNEKHNEKFIVSIAFWKRRIQNRRVLNDIAF